jgi:hydrogenase nickel incorporation protein HypA/HybF
MHELAITREIVATVLAQSGSARVTRVRVEIGKLAGVLPGAVRFCFELCVEGTRAQGAELVILEPAGRGRCRACGLELDLEGPYAACDCGSYDLECLCGDQLLIRDMEVRECAPPAAVPTAPARS